MPAARRLLLLRVTTIITTLALVMTLTGPVTLRVPVVLAASWDTTVVYIQAYGDETNCYFSGYQGPTAFNALGGAYWAAQFNSGTAMDIYKGNGTTGCGLAFGFAEHPNTTLITSVMTKSPSNANPGVSIIDNYPPYATLCQNSNVASCAGDKAISSRLTNGFALWLNGSTSNSGTLHITSVGIYGDPPYTPTPGATATNTQTPTVTPTPTVTLTPSPTNTPGGPTDPPPATIVAPSGNLLRNWDFATPPRLPDSYWQAMNRVVQSPYEDAPMPLEGLPYGSCGYEYWSMSRTAGTDGEIWQPFGWTGGPMYINFEAQTNSWITRGQAYIMNEQTGEEEFFTPFTNGSHNWLTYKYVTASKPAGQYRIGFTFDTVGPTGGLAVDNVNVRRSYFGNDCPQQNYHGQMPTTAGATAAAQASPTADPLQPNTPINQNCGFEQGWNGYSHNAGTRLVYTGGATGPTYAYLFTVYGNGSDPESFDIPGRLASPFYWPGGQMMYVSYWTGPGTRATVTLRNVFTGYSRVLQSPATAQSYNGWVKSSQGFFVPDAGNYFVEINVPAGQIGAFDGLAVSTGGFSSACGSSNSTGDNNATATQHIVNSQVAATATNQPAVILTANAVGTNQAAAYATYLAGQYATMTQHAAQTQTQRVPATQTQAARATATRQAQQTATAQGTPPAPTRTAPPQPSPWPGGDVCVLDPLQMVWVCPDPPEDPVDPGPSDAELTAIALTLTAEANAQATFWAAAQQTAEARASGTAAYQQTQAYAPIQQTQRALQTSVAFQATLNAAAHATQTAIVDAISAQQTQNAAATQHALQNAATQTAVAGQATASAGNSTQQADATNTAVAYATQYSAVTATANAQLTQDSVNHAAATATRQAQQTANAAATGVSLATQQQQQQQATQTAAALQTSLPATANATAIAGATTTAQVYATTYAQVTATARAQATVNAATQQASGTLVPGDTLPPVDGRPEPQPGVDCIRPTSPLQVANWIDYEVCRVLTWFAWSPANGEQLADIQASAAEAGPFGLVAEVGETMGVFWSWLTTQGWCDTGFCQDQPLAPLNLEASGILNGNWDFADGGPAYSDQCTILMGPLLGPYIQSGACFCINIACALGILPWFQLVFNVLLVIMLLVYVQRTWLTAAHT